MTTNQETTMATNIDLAMTAAREYREGKRTGLLNPAALAQLEDNISNWVGSWDEHGVLTIPAVVAEAMGKRDPHGRGRIAAISKR